MWKYRVAPIPALDNGDGSALAPPSPEPDHGKQPVVAGRETAGLPSWSGNGNGLCAPEGEAPGVKLADKTP